MPVAIGVGNSPVFLSVFLSGATWYSGLTDLVAVYQPIGAASLAASYVNLVNPGTFDAAPGVAPTHDPATGWIFNGSTQFLTTGVVPGNNWSMIARFSDGVITGSNRSICGSDNFVLRNYQASTKFFVNGTFTSFGSPAAAGVMGVTDRAYFNGTVGGVVLSGLGATINPVFLGAQSLSGSPVNYFAGNIQAFAICSSTQTDDQIATASAAMAAL